MITSQYIIDFLNGYNPTEAALTSDQINSLTIQLRTQINQLSVSVPRANSEVTTVLYSGWIDTPGGSHTGAVAANLVENNPLGKVLTINQTDIIQGTQYSTMQNLAHGPNCKNSDTQLPTPYNAKRQSAAGCVFLRRRLQ